MSAVPAVIPVTAPLVEFTVAIAVLPLVHMPPGVLLLNVVADASHTSGVPVMAPGVAFTLTVIITGQMPPTT